MRFTITSMIAALQLSSALVLPRSEAAEYSALGGIEPFNTTFAEAHLVHPEGPVLEAASISSEEISTRAIRNVYVCINAGFQPACTVMHWTNDKCANFVNPWDDSISSWGPDPGVTCHVYDRRNCDEGGRKI
ncbi:hypothetical protein LA080_010357 [Diaporthe eres]|uniref:Uncharacterized protein n=1 Tax=Diaporthe vaccinii TaxID=105482 RepID=A0ABR4DPI4_9PEZI|nr:hypothetical protein LA080_010357 [Diaporthe eres]